MCLDGPYNNLFGGPISSIFYFEGGKSSNDFSRLVSPDLKKGPPDAHNSEPRFKGPYDDINFPKIATNF